MTTLGIDLAVRAAHVATLADERGEQVWSRRRFHNRRDDLDALTADVGPAAELTVVMEPTRNAWAPVAAHFLAVGAKVVLVAPEQAADLRAYYSKHTKNDRLDSVLLSRLPLLHPEGLIELGDLGPADALKRAVRRRVRLVEARGACQQRIDALLDLLGPGYHDVFGARLTKSALEVLERYGDPRALRRLGVARLAALIKRTSGGAWGHDQAAEMLRVADEAIALWAGGGLDFTELAWDLASEVRVMRQFDVEVTRLEGRIAALYEAADPKQILRSVPGVGPVLAGGILGRLGDVNRFANLAAVRSFSGMVPGVNQSGRSQGHPGITKQGDAGLRRDIWFAADLARHHDPQLAAKYHRLVVERGLHHYSALCHIATTLLTRLAACWRNNQFYVIRDVDGRTLSPSEARTIIAERYKVQPQDRRRSVRPKTKSGPRVQGIRHRVGERAGQTGVDNAAPNRPAPNHAKP